MKEVADERETDPFETIFAKRGEVQKRSGSKKLVIYFFLSRQFIIEFCLSVLYTPSQISLQKVQKLSMVKMSDRLVENFSKLYFLSTINPGRGLSRNIL